MRAHAYLRAAVVLAALLLAPVAHLGVVYLLAASALGLGFIALSVRLWLRATPKAAMQLFSYSISYLTLLFVAMAVDVLVHH